MEYRVLVGTCGEPHREFLASLVGLIVDFSENGQGGDVHRLGLSIQRGSILPQLRHKIVRKALEIESTHILFADSDQDFPPYTLRALLSHRLPVVGANIATKILPSIPTARLKSGHSGVPLYPGGNGVIKVWRLGLGLVLVETEVFRKIDPPWFEVRYEPEIDDFMGEDWFFMSRLEAAGIGVYVDQDLSAEVGHWGELRYGLELANIGTEDIISKCRKSLKLG